MDYKKLKRVRLLTFIFSLVGPIIIIGGSMVAMFIFGLKITVTAIAAIAMIVLLFVYSVFVIQPLSDYYKKEIYKEISNGSFNINEFSFKSALKEDYLTSKCLLSMDQKDHHETYNYLKCSWNNYDFHTADILIYNGNATRKNKENKTKNAGFWGIVEIPSMKNKEIYIIHKNKINLNLVKWLDADKRLKKVNAKNEKINNNYYMFSVHEHPKYLDEKLTMAISRLKETTKGEICLHIINGKIHFLVLNHIEPFEPELKRNITKEKIDEIKRKFKTIIQFIDNLNNE